uniref:Biopolymer transport protein ExbD/TolR n=1 Tax=uncultured bacterium CSL1 TaxID=1091565 RepID=G4WV93_9BACT|nr:biopolymer transport protein ExbD/TolR [uncultured bacterium CSL1]
MRQVSLIPLIDVSMFLLIYFMLAGTVEKFEILPIDPPLAESGKMMDEGHLTIMLGTHDEIIVGDELVEYGHLQAALKDQLQPNPNKVVTLKADARVPAGRVIDIMDQIKIAGGQNLSLATQAKDRKP